MTQQGGGSQAALERFYEVLHANKIFTSGAFPHVETAPSRPERVPWRDARASGAVVGTKEENLTVLRDPISA
jgi:hypothetical protein